MKKQLVIIFSFFIFHFSFTSPAFAQSCSDYAGGHCIWEAGGQSCGTDEENKGVLDCNPDWTCCALKVPSSPADCPEGKTYVAIFRTCLDFGEFAGALINWLMIIAAGLAIIKIAAGGIQYIFASGDPKNLENAHATMTSAIVGLMLVLLAWVIMKLIGELTPESWQIRLLGG